jgi:Flp pilus assembly pilin Flp
MTARWIARLARNLRRLHRDQRGADMVEYILIVAAIALPLLGVVVWFWEDISSWVKEQYEDIKSGEGTDPDDL